ncbi:hypothetical protein GQ54DRAFT_296106 [Martensiomyces pterosporus]|nr:hypothetical protein GQ54DRAFT_296106 [Martensiomyces pterosporus]
MHVSAIHQTFWDRIPNATSKIALLAKHQDAAGSLHSVSPEVPVAELPPPRVSKRKQGRPMRSPQAPVSLHACSSHSPGAHPIAKARRLSLDHLAAASARGRREDGVGLVSCDTGLAGDAGPHMSRAFRLSFPDDYSRNPHKYIQALLDCEHMLAGPAHKPHSSSSRSSRRNNNPSSSFHSHSTRSSNGSRDHSRSKPQSSGAGTRRSRSTRFHNLQLEQTMSATQSENEDTNSVTTAASDLNDLNDIDSHVPGTPTRSHSLAASGPAPSHDSFSMSLRCASKSPFVDRDGTPKPSSSQQVHSSPSLVPANGGDAKSPLVTPLSLGDESAAGSPLHSADRRGSTAPPSNAAPSHPDSPASQSSADSPSLTPPNVHSEDNMPSYTRLGQDFSDDVSQVIPLCKKSTVKWTKADPIDIEDKPMADRLAMAERHCCSILRILPEQYMTIKHTLLKEGRNRSPGTFKKRDAQRLCRIDVNKTSKIYEWYVSMGWLPASNGVYAIPPAVAEQSDATPAANPHQQ